MNAPLCIGVVVPVLNGAPYIEATLRAISKQTLPPDRLIVVDNGSVDGTLLLLEHLAREIPLTVLREDRPGASAARDAGWRAIPECDLIAFCDADDVWHCQKLEKQAALFQDDHEGTLVCVYCANRCIDAAGTEIDRSGLPTLRGYIHGSVAQGHPILGSMSAVVIRRSDLEAAGGFDPSLLADEDLDIFIRLSLRGRFDFVPEFLTDLRSHAAQTSRNAERLLHSKSQIINKYPELYKPGSSFIESVRVEHLRLDLQAQSRPVRLLRAVFFPLFFMAQARRLTTGRARILLFPGFMAYSFWLFGRTLIHASNRLSRRALGNL